MDILEILKSKPHNQHYLNRYWKFIQYCKDSNKNLEPNTYIEKHHICPKAKDLFPLHSRHVWNLISLTSRQHILSHIMLWKTYGGSQIKALDCIFGEFNKNNITKMFNRKIPKSIEIRYAAKVRDLSKGMSTYKDSQNNKYYLHKDDIKIKELNLVGNNEGLQHSEQSKEKQRRAKDYNRTIKMYFLTIRRNIKIREMQMYLDQGWATFRTAQEKTENRLAASPAKKEKMQGRSRWAYPDGTFHSFIKSDDPIIKELGLIPQVTEKAKEQFVKRSELAKQANTGSKFYNNGTIMKKFKEDPGGEWKLGQLPRNRSAQKAACGARKGKLSWNNGVITIYALESPGIEWVRGMAPRL